VTVSVFDEPTGEWCEVEVDGANALDAIHHPYAYSDAGQVSPLTDA
jgi:hypothetical protein